MATEKRWFFFRRKWNQSSIGQEEGDARTQCSEWEEMDMNGAMMAGSDRISTDVRCWWCELLDMMRFHSVYDENNYALNWKLNNFVCFSVGTENANHGPSVVRQCGTEATARHHMLANMGTFLLMNSFFFHSHNVVGDGMKQTCGGEKKNVERLELKLLFVAFLFFSTMLLYEIQFRMRVYSSDVQIYNGNNWNCLVFRFLPGFSHQL